eukprot:scaffold99696_cov20-Cyclotella_meneghiniana.AAC.1
MMIAVYRVRGARRGEIQPLFGLWTWLEARGVKELVLLAIRVIKKKLQRDCRAIDSPAATLFYSRTHQCLPYEPNEMPT